MDIKNSQKGRQWKNKHVAVTAVLCGGKMCHGQLPVPRPISTWQSHRAECSQRHNGEKCEVHRETTHLPCKAPALHRHCGAKTKIETSKPFITTTLEVQLGLCHHNLSLHLNIYSTYPCCIILKCTTYMMTHDVVLWRRKSFEVVRVEKPTLLHPSSFNLFKSMRTSTWTF